LGGLVERDDFRDGVMMLRGGAISLVDANDWDRLCVLWWVATIFAMGR
jgi:hypothetical protein